MNSLLLRTVLACGFVAATLAAQVPETPLVISMDVRRVALYVTVREGKAKFVGDLAKEHFSVKEDGAPQEIISFSRDDVPVAIGLLVDNSQSMMNKSEEVVAAAKAFVHASNPGDEMFVLIICRPADFQQGDIAKARRGQIPRPGLRFTRDTMATH